eukprot:TRINITY_DN68400_c0_g1_i1.p1 TRINITY_DN68400_c0_g1~~TRINITY_DN68400_c0_g1_i1.p1  ORF type:complete len:257 (-),score=17.80 TRINITY_DN68400_c0_g1_i1:267-968(-)
MAATATKKISIVQQSTHKRAPKFSFQSRPETKNSGQAVPGPGQYGRPSIDLNYKSTQNVSFGSSTRTMAKDFKGLPGPGKYEPKDPYATSPMFGFGSGSRLPKVKDSGVPPPGHYDVRNGPQLKTFTMGGSRVGKKSPATPGPGQYEGGGLKKGYEMTWHQDMQTRIAPGTRPSCLDVKSDTPGPGHYTQTGELGKTNVASRSCPNFSLYSRRKPVKSDSTPGPIYPHYTQFD